MKALTQYYHCLQSSKKLVKADGVDLQLRHQPLYHIDDEFYKEVLNDLITVIYDFQSQKKSKPDEYVDPDYVRGYRLYSQLLNYSEEQYV